MHGEWCVSVGVGVCMGVGVGVCMGVGVGAYVLVDLCVHGARE